MGQKFSDLRGIIRQGKLKIMEDKTNKRELCEYNYDNKTNFEILSALVDENGNESMSNFVECSSKSENDSELKKANITVSNVVQLDNEVNKIDVPFSDYSSSYTLKCDSDTNAVSTESKPSKCRLRKKQSHKSEVTAKESVTVNKKKKNHWVLQFNCARLKKGSSSSNSDVEIADRADSEACVCTGYRKTEEQRNGEGAEEEEVDESPEEANPAPFPPAGLFYTIQSVQTTSAAEEEGAWYSRSEPIVDLSKFNPDDYPIEDCDERARLERAREIAEGVDAPPGFSPRHHQIELVCPTDLSIDNLTALFRSAFSLSALAQTDPPRSVHTQIDYIHCLVPDLSQITSCSFYWGKMDRYEAERLLEGKPEGTFLLRDSAQEEYLFSVSFRKYGRSLHARIEQWNHKFSFDSHDPGVFASPTVCGLIEHYKDPTCCMFFEPMLTIPLHRTFTFSLQHLCRAVICDTLTYDDINKLKLPKAMKSYLKEYHYKQRVRVRKFDNDP